MSWWGGALSIDGTTVRRRRDTYTHVCERPTPGAPLNEEGVPRDADDVMDRWLEVGGVLFDALPAGVKINATLAVGASGVPIVRRPGAAAPRFAYKLAPAVVVGGAAAVDLTAMVEGAAGGDRRDPAVAAGRIRTTCLFELDGLRASVPVRGSWPATALFALAAMQPPPPAPAASARAWGLAARHAFPDALGAYLACGLHRACPAPGAHADGCDDGAACRAAQAQWALLFFAGKLWNQDSANPPRSEPVCSACGFRCVVPNGHEVYRGLLARQCRVCRAALHRVCGRPTPDGPVCAACGAGRLEDYKKELKAVEREHAKLVAEAEEKRQEAEQKARRRQELLRLLAEAGQ